MACKNFSDELQYSEWQTKSKSPNRCFLYVETLGWGASSFLDSVGVLVLFWSGGCLLVFCCVDFFFFFKDSLCYHVQIILETENTAA